MPRFYGKEDYKAKARAALPYTVVQSELLSTEGDPRFIVIEVKTGMMLDDARGYGYKSIETAYNGFAYKCNNRLERRENFPIYSVYTDK